MIYARLEHLDHQQLREQILCELDYSVPQDYGVHPVELELAELVQQLGAEPTRWEIMVLPPGVSAQVHRDAGAGTEFVWSVNTPLEGWQGSSTRFYSTQGRPRQRGGAWIWDHSQCKCTAEYVTQGVFAMDTRHAHAIASSEPRTTLLMRMPVNWCPTININAARDGEVKRV